MDARLIALALLLALPVVGADHVFSHRAIVVGRVIDSDGMPAPGLPVNVTFEGARATGRCFDSRAEVTGPMGDYEVCRHVHDIPPGASVTVRVGDASRTVPLDPDLRHASASIELASPREHQDVNGDRTFARTFLVVGRSFQLLPRTQQEEGIEVAARPLAGDVNVSLRVGDETLAGAVADPDEHGLYRAELAVGEIPAGATARAVVSPDGGEELASTRFRRADLNVVRDLRLVEGPGEDAPGTRTPVDAWLAIVALIGSSAVVAARARRS